MYHKLIPSNIEITKKWKTIWHTKEIHVLMLLSLLIQIILTFFAPRRKTVSKATLSLLMWLLYLSADAVALYAIGLISKNNFPGDSFSNNQGCNVAQNAVLLAFWAPFLLLHLGGPDTITALALQDNELWHRHALQLATQVVLTVYVFFRAFAGKIDVYVLIPTVLMFVDGCVKYIERTCALYSASVENIRDAITRKPEEMSPNYSLLMEEYGAARNAGIPVYLDDVSARAETSLEESDNPTTSDQLSSVHWCDVEENDEMIRDAHNCFVKVQGLLADAYLNVKDRNEIRSVFLEKKAADAVKIVEIELNFIYDILYTKAFLLQKKRAFVRVLCFLAVAVSLVLFSLSYKKSNNYEGLDVVVTFALLGGAIALDLCAFIMLVFSDWWVILMSSDDVHKTIQTAMKLLHLLLTKVKSTTRNRWSQSISKYNLLTCCFREPPSFLKYVFIERIKNLIVGLIYVETVPVDKKYVLKFVVEELQRNSKVAGDLEKAKDVTSARGNLVNQKDYFLVSECLKQWTVDLDYDASVLTWHVATDICYWTTFDQFDQSSTGNEATYRFISKELSDYMSYLLLRQQGLTSPVMGLSHFRFKDTCTEAKNKSYSSGNLDPWFTHICYKGRKMVYELLRRKQFSPDKNKPREDAAVLKEFCKKALDQAMYRSSIGVSKGDVANSVLFEACYLAKRLEMFGDKQWEITSKVWVEMLSYAATRCSPRSHLAQLSKGGELITIVWLLMSHLGLGDRFMQTQGLRWSKLIIHK